jgi:uncharacterized protein YbjT (DUF2867 family)
MTNTSRNVFIAGGTGYMGQHLIPRLLERGDKVRALVRPGSEAKLPSGCTPIVGSALDRNSYLNDIHPADTFVQLVGVSHPSPAKANAFRSIDLVAGGEAVLAAAAAGISHFVYVSVAQPAPVMKAYIAVRAECEEMIRRSQLNATILRPWYVLGPGHRWPYALKPAYWLLEKFPFTRAGARRLGLVTREQMVTALVNAVDHQPQGIRIWGVPEIRAADVGTASWQATIA